MIISSSDLINQNNQVCSAMSYAGLQSKFYPSDNGSMNVALSYLSYYVPPSRRVWVVFNGQWSSGRALASNLEFMGSTTAFTIFCFIFPNKLMYIFLLFKFQPTVSRSNISCQVLKQTRTLKVVKSIKFAILTPFAPTDLAVDMVKLGSEAERLGST